MKKQVLITISYIAEVDETLMTGRRDQEKRNIFNEFEESFPEEVVIKEEFKAKWEKTSRCLLDERFNNCLKCAKCGSWVTDTNQPNHLAGLSRCEYIDGSGYCTQCAEDVRRENSD